MHQDEESDTPMPQPSRANLDTLDLASPITTLRSLGALEGDRQSPFSPYDPIARGVLVYEEAQEAFQM